ncbi:MAG: ATP-binding protein [Minisyncoccia bacterium]
MKPKDILEKIRKDIYFYFLIFIIFFLFVSLFVKDFNLLKVFLFLAILFNLNFLFLHLYLKKKQTKEKPSFFSFLEKILGNLQEGIVIYDENLKIFYANEKFAEIVNLKREDLKNLEVGQWMIKNKTYEILGNLFFPFINGEEIQIISEKPSEIIEVKFSFTEERYFTISYFDEEIDGKMYKFRLIIEKTKDIIESRKRIEFIQIVSHNLLTPLSEIRWLLESLDEEKLDEENKKIIENILDIVTTTIVFSQNILNFIRAEKESLSLNLTEVYIDEIFKKILKILKRKIEEKKISVNVEIYEKARKIYGDENLIFLCLFTITENAVVYNKEFGEINILAEKIEGRPYIKIEIKDTGIGMTEKDLKNLFKKYYRGEKAKEKEVGGFGIGLYLAKKIIELHGGEIKVESEENKGTKVTVTLPLEKELIPGII